MVAKFAIFSCLVAAAAAVAVPILPVTKVAYAEPELPAQYDFEYSVHDSQSGDVKQQKESRSGDAVHGSYSLVQPDGIHRIVDYTSDNEHGFNAIVRYEGTPIAAPAKIAYAAAPVAKVAYSPAPVSYAAAPVAKIAYAPAPINYASAPVTYAQAPINYAQGPLNYAQGPISYAQAPVAYAHTPVAKVAYNSPLGHVAFSSPAVNYHH